MDKDNLIMLVSMGFDHSQSERALKKYVKTSFNCKKQLIRLNATRITV